MNQNNMNNQNMMIKKDMSDINIMKNQNMMNFQNDNKLSKYDA